MLETLDAPAVRHWCRAGLDALAGCRGEIDALNVYPVADGDTGTNLCLTMQAAHEALARLPDSADAAAALDALASGALLGARGSSGMILSQLLRGIASAAPTSAGPLDARSLAVALHRAAELARASVARPVDGTMLTVARAAADAAGRATGGIAAVAAAAAEGARDALAATPRQLEVLRRAGVVDAGGRGLCVLLDMLAGTIGGVPAAVAPDGRPSWAASPPPAGSAPAAPGAAPAYEVTYLLDAADDDVPRLRAALGRLGEAAVVVGGGGLWNVHVHVCDPGAAVEQGVRAGRPHGVRIRRLPTAPPARLVLAVVGGAGLAVLAASAGADVVRRSTAPRPCAGELLERMRRTGAPEVVVVPGDDESLAAAEVAAGRARRQGRRVVVVPCRAAVQALAALAVHDPARGFDDDVAAMCAAAGATRHGAVTVAARDARTTAGPCRAGDVLGVLDGDVAIVGDDLASAACQVADRLLASGGELVTLVVGEDADAVLPARVVHHLSARRPEVEVVVHEGGQPRYPLLLGVE